MYRTPPWVDRPRVCPISVWVPAIDSDPPHQPSRLRPWTACANPRRRLGYRCRPSRFSSLWVRRAICAASAPPRRCVTFRRHSARGGALLRGGKAREEALHGIDLGEVGGGRVVAAALAGREAEAAPREAVGRPGAAEMDGRREGLALLRRSGGDRAALGGVGDRAVERPGRATDGRA